MNIQKADINFRSSLNGLNLNVINGIVFHHMGDNGIKAWWDRVHSWHLDNGWSGFGYNYWISLNGEIFEGRGMNQGAHARGHNSSKIGIGFQGDFNVHQMTDAQVRSARWLVKELNNKVGRKLRLYQHKDVGVTSCAGNNFRMNDIKDKNTQKNEVNDVILRKGMSGPNIKQLQNDGLSLGYELPRFGADGKFGNETVAMVKQLQRDHGLTVDGIAGPQTLGKIENLKQADEYLYRVQVGAFSNEGNALAMEQRLKDAGFETYVVKQ